VNARIAALAAAALLVPAASPALSADTLPDVAAIREKIRAASGPRATSYHETDETVRSNGVTIVEHDFVRGDDHRYTFDAGRFHTEIGHYKLDDWHMNDNGQVVIDEPDPGKATAEPLKTTVSAIHSPVEGYAISTLNAHGHGRKEYVDGSAWRVVRVDVLTLNGTIVTTYDDVRLDHGRTFAHHVHVENGYAHTTSDLRITEYTPQDVPEREVEIPNPRRALVEFGPGGSPVELPTTFGDSHVYVRVTINGRGLDFVLDTGASGITIDSGVARQLGLPEYGVHSEVTAGRYTTARTVIPEMRIGSLVMHDVAVQEVPHGWNTAPDVKEVGLLGFDFIAELGVTIDYEHRRVTVVPAANYVAPTDPHAIPLNVRIGDGAPAATATLNGAVGERWILDTGGAGTFMVFDYFARRHPEALRDRGGGNTNDRQVQLYGIGGDIKARPYQIESLKLANVNFKDFVGYRVTGGSYDDADDGIIGVGFLRLFTLGLDYANSRVYLVPNSAGRRAMGIK
jgi:clan AA aspartic protease (TIGR02281 family)